MDFGRLLHKAQKNEQTSKNQVRYYSTKFEPPKKEQRSKELSVNVKRFLARKEQEEKQKLEEAKKRKEDLLALRAQDKKATRRVNVMLKRTKSANQSVIQDAVDDDNTAVTLAGPVQPDEDDYGYVSQEASAFYNKMMEKYSKMPDEKKFDFTKKKVDTNLKGTKDRVKAALEKEREEALLPHKRKRKHKDGDGGSKCVDEVEKYEPERPQMSEKPKPKAKPAPPPMNFADLLKIAEKKQFEPIVIEQKTKEEEKPLTKKQKREMEMERQYRERKEQREKELSQYKAVPSKKPKIESKPVPPKVVSNDRIPKLSNGDKTSKISLSKTPEKSRSTDSKIAKPSTSQPIKPVEKQREPSNHKSNSSNGFKHTSKESPMRKIPSGVDIKYKKLSPVDMKPKKFPPSDLKPKEFPPKDLKPKNRLPPPPDMSRFPVKKKPMVNKRRILDDDDSEYDSEMDDFIDDGPEDMDDYSKHISEIFGYDKSRYRDVDEDVDCMESTFAQQMKEEAISKKIGIMEDLEDMRLEEEQKRRKMAIKKQRR